MTMYVYIWHESNSETVYGTKETTWRGRGKKGEQKNGEICSMHNIYLYENFENNFKKKFLLESSFWFSFPLDIPSTLLRKKHQ